MNPNKPDRGTERLEQELATLRGATNAMTILLIAQRMLLMAFIARRDPTDKAVISAMMAGLDQIVPAADEAFIAQVHAQYHTLLRETFALHGGVPRPDA